ncbi:MAG: mechanosensitive ion channel [Chloroflexi bacterium]|nr:mechanosensitive ion channel [Chloroflexota bacterium]
MNLDAPELALAAGIFTSGILLAWLISAGAVIVENRLSTLPRDRKAWQKAHRQALFWLLVVITIAISIRSVEASDDFAIEVQRITSVIGAFLGSMALIHTSNELLGWYVRGRLRIRPFLSTTALPIVQRFASIAIVVMSVVFVLDVFGQPVTPLLAILSVFGFGIALALRDPLANFFAGTTLAADGGLRIGDSIEIESEHGPWGTIMGTVVGIGWRSTRIVTRSSNVVTVPNNKLGESFLTNYSAPSRDMGVSIRAGVALGSDLTLAEEAALEIAGQLQEEHMVSGQAFKPTFVFDGFANNAVTFTVVLRARSYDDSSRLISDFIKALDTRFRSEGIELKV